MGKRLSKIYTRTGDNGETGLGDGSRVFKDCQRVEAYGSVDELNSVIGLLLCESLPDSIERQLCEIQHRLFDVGGELSLPDSLIISAELVIQLEDQLDALNAELANLEEFILPGGSRSAAWCHLARTVCRRVERCLIRLRHTEAINDQTIIYINRLSDYFFVVARYLNKIAGVDDVLWKSQRVKSSSDEVD